jgi:single-stranded-DNA-specific exonuclease
MSQAVTRLRQAIRRRERIAIYGDFDVDGVTATALLVQTLSALGGQVEPYIPNRVDEGYGLNLPALRHLWQRGVRLVVTVDCGIRSIDEVAKASRGLDLIITDHHSPGQEIPPALAVINPRQPDCPYPFKKLAGVGIAFKLAQALLLVQDRTPAGQGTTRLNFSEEELLDLVALGTVADLAPLLGENRSLVRQGLKVLNEALRPGVEALMAEADLRRNDVDATAIGFRLGPRLNAAGRIGSAMLAYNLLMNRDPLETKALAERLGALNAERRRLTEETVAAAEAQVLSEHPDAYLYLAASEAFKSGIVGLAASRLAEAFYRPSIVVELGRDWSRGSCRSIPEFNITHALDQCEDLLKRHGGHAAAAGFTIATTRLDAFRSRLQAIAAEQLADVELRPALEIDAEIPLEEVSWATHDLLLEMEPCGVDNPQPVLLSHDLYVRDRRTMGSERRHLRLTVRDGRGVAWDAIHFGGGNLVSQIPDRIDLAYTLEANEWNHERRLQLNIQDLRPATTSERS